MSIYPFLQNNHHRTDRYILYNLQIYPFSGKNLSKRIVCGLHNLTIYPFFEKNLSKRIVCDLHNLTIYPFSGKNLSKRIVAACIACWSIRFPGKSVHYGQNVEERFVVCLTKYGMARSLLLDKLRFAGQFSQSASGTFRTANCRYSKQCLHLGNSHDRRSCETHSTRGIMNF